MAELSQASEVYAPKTLQVWRTLLNWLTFFFQISLQIIRGTPSLTRLFFSSLFSSPPQFKPLPVVELPESPEPPPSASVPLPQIDGGGVASSHDELPLPRLTVVLDLDETLICAYETSSMPPAIRSLATEAGLHWFELECISSEKGCDGKPKINYVTVFERPGLHQFLKQLSEFADLVLFTAGLEGYARPLVDKIDAENRFIHRLYRPSTTRTEYREHVKDLFVISKDVCRIVLVDNNPFSFLLQPLNGIPCVPFSPGHPHDKQLMDVILPLLKDLSLEKDVRPVLHERFGMLEWFQNHGIPASALFNDVLV